MILRHTLDRRCTERRDVVLQLGLPFLC